MQVERDISGVVESYIEEWLEGYLVVYVSFAHIAPDRTCWPFVT
jgi:hypothetical protein